MLSWAFLNFVADEKTAPIAVLACVEAVVGSKKVGGKFPLNISYIKLRNSTKKLKIK